jgi:thiosulfate/3-mercaptopyruvate sulfurtransferase
MPSAINIPYTDVLSARTKAFLPASELKVYFECKNIDGKNPIVSTCGTGVTASVLDIALQEAGIGEGARRVYDGSWTEWGSRVGEDEGLVVKKQKAKAKTEKKT